MFRIIRPSKDTYITNKAIRGLRAYDANVGQAGTLDLYSLFNESQIKDETTGQYITGSVWEVSRALIKFEYDKVQEMISNSKLDINSPNFTASLVLKDVYGGQTVPSNYTLELLPLAKDWTEGRGFDVIGYQHIDAANFLTASVNGSTIVTWSLPGANAKGNLTQSNVDVFVSGNLGSGLQYMGVLCTFLRGDEPLEANITQHVSASIAGLLPNNGFRLSYTEGEENEEYTYFVKRFGTSNVQSSDLRPALNVQSVDDIIRDDTGRALFSPFTQNFFAYNQDANGSFANFYDNNSYLSGSYSLLMRLSTTKDITVLTSSYSVAHEMTITYSVSTTESYSTTFTASQYYVGSIPVDGYYKCSFVLDPYQDSGLMSFLDNNPTETTFTVDWVSPSTTNVLQSEEVTFKPIQKQSNFGIRRNYVASIQNLRSLYSHSSDGWQRMYVFVQDYNTELVASRIPAETKSDIVPGMKYRIRKAYENSVYIPFCDATELSYDKDGMYFDFYVDDFEPGYIYQIDLLISSGHGSQNDYLIQDSGWRFKVID